MRNRFIAYGIRFLVIPLFARRRIFIFPEDPGGMRMNAFVPVPRDVRECQVYREALLAQPPEFFQAHYGISPDPVAKLSLVERMIQTMGAPRIYMNDTYVVRMREMGPFIQLNIARIDGQPCKSWRDFQQIKNELVGPDCEGMELFPAENRLVDTSNEYHMWVHPDRNYRFPVGFQRRMVIDTPLVSRREGLCPQLDNTAQPTDTAPSRS